MTIDLSAGTGLGGDAAGDVLTDIEDIDGSAYDDILSGNTAANALDGGAGNDQLVGGAGADDLDGGSGIDKAIYTSSASGVTVDLSAGTGLGGDAAGDVLTDIEDIDGSAYDDILTGDTAANALSGGAGNDQLVGGAGADDLDGGSGIDKAIYGASATGVTVDLSAGTGLGGDAAGDVLTDIEDIDGSAYADILTGDTAANALSGGAGNDQLVGGVGADDIDGGSGVDKAIYTVSSAGVTVDLAAGTGLGGDAAGDVLSGIEDIDGSAHDDVLTGDSAINALDGGAGNDWIEGAAGADTLDGGAGSDWVAYTQSASAVTVDLLAGTTSGGDAAGDSLSNFENIEGSAHNDTLTGDTAANLLQGGGGDDTLVGGLGEDVAVFSGVASGYQITSDGVQTTVTDTDGSNGDEGTDTLSGIEVLRFADGDLYVPIALDGTASLAEDGTVNGRFAASDVETLVGSLTYALYEAANDGTAIVNANGTYSYTPDGGFSGSDSFRYRVIDGDGMSTVATVSIDVVAAMTASSEIGANTYTTDDQNQPSIASLSGGGFVVVWTSAGQDGSLGGVYGQRYDAAGATAGSEFLVNTATTNPQLDPSVADLSGGGFVVIWTADDAADGQQAGIFGQRYDSSGVASGSEFQVNTYWKKDEDVPSVTGLDGGGFVVTWTSKGQDGGNSLGVFAQRYDSSGVAAGSEFQVNGTSSGNQYETAVAALSGGGFVVTWRSDGQDGSGAGVYGQRYNATGVAQGSEFLVNTTTSSDQDQSSITGLTGGGFVVAWRSNGQDGSGTGIYAQRYSSVGVALGSEFLVNSYTTLDQAEPSIAASSDGGFIVTWRSDGQDGSGDGVYGQRYDSSGTSVGAEFRVNDTTTNAQTSPAIVGLADGDFAVAWQSAGQDGSGDGVYAKLYATITDQTLTGSAGSDALVGAAGDDTLTGGASGDDLDGGAGSDTASYAASPSGVTINLTAATASGGDAAGDILVDIENLEGSLFADTLTGDANANTLVGLAGADTLSGLGGDDRLDGGTGADSLTGGLGSDTFTFKPGYGADAVTDFDLTSGTGDVADITDTAFDDLATVLANATQQSADTVIDFGSGDTLTLVGIDKTSLASEHFVFG